VGLDASVVDRVDSHPRLKSRLGEYYYTYAAVSTFAREYLVDPPHVSVNVNGDQVEGVTVIAQNSEQHTYFGRRPIKLAPNVTLDHGTLGVVVLKGARPIELPTVGWRAFSGQAKTLVRHRQVESFPQTLEATLTSVDGGTFPVQVDGGFIGRWEQARLTVAPKGLRVLG
jgi:diacylglycerol kinase family enzyme